MTFIKQTFILAIATCFAGCRFILPTAYFFISNSSRDKKAVDIKVNIGRAMLLEKFWHDTSFVNYYLRGTPSQLGIFIMDERPVHE